MIKWSGGETPPIKKGCRMKKIFLNIAVVVLLVGSGFLLMAMLLDMFMKGVL